ncbi:PREDICTED: V-set and immunoglobulin domain-containing protein 2-like [Gekko japonicus]|uniref:V-set and immunoglobulin domain-containing protein 2-like n=1 Tax=Gekko japonicus TaxID=146911 RepID=UPI00074FB20C|nr:PREDICTED: V-set and immunoglobulin domain-containing protein 2-like [Gekko japonicus]
MQQKGLSVELPCHYKTSVNKNFVLEWKFAPGSTSPENAEQMLYFTNNKLYKPGSQAERLSLLHDPPTLGDASLRLVNVRKSDAGTYFCEVNDPPDFYGTGSGHINFVVLMPPSSPVCKGTAYAPLGSDATLSCSSSEDEQTGSLLLTNVSQEFSGTYQCIASNEYGQESCQISLHVTGVSSAKEMPGMNHGPIRLCRLTAMKELAECSGVRSRLSDDSHPVFLPRLPLRSEPLV